MIFWLLVALNLGLLFSLFIFNRLIDEKLEKYSKVLENLKAQRQSKYTGNSQPQDIEKLKEKIMQIAQKRIAEKFKEVQLSLKNKIFKLNTVLLAIKDISSSLNFSDILKKVENLFTKTFKLKDGAVFFINEDKKTCVCIKKWGLAPWVEQEKFNIKDSPLVDYLLNKAEGLLLPQDMRSNPAFTPFLKKGDLAADLAIPLQSFDEKIGFILVKNVKEIPKEEAVILYTLGNVIGLIIENAKQFTTTLEELTHVKELSKKEMEEKKKLKDLFSKYVSPQVVNELIKNPNAAGLGGAKRKIAVFFSDIRGFTSMSEKMDPVDIVEALNKYFSAMTEIIFEYKGTLDKYIGDAIMALFGAPLELEGETFLAIASGLKMQEKLKEINEELENNALPTIKMGIGITYGEVVVGNIGSYMRMDYTAIGDTVNLSSRLCGKAAPGEILVDKDTFSRVSELFEAEELDEIKVKGKEKPIKVYKIKDFTLTGKLKLQEVLENAQ